MVGQMRDLVMEGVVLLLYYHCNFRDTYQEEDHLQRLILRKEITAVCSWNFVIETMGT